MQFYERDEFLTESVASYIAAGLQTGEAAILIATPRHRAEMRERLLHQGIDLAASEKRGQYVELDAAETLARFMVRSCPDERLFDKVVGALVRKELKHYGKLRAFGEMVALLWDDGNANAAIRLEDLWNDLAKTNNFALLCAYPIDAFADSQSTEQFLHICHQHSHVLPAERIACKTNEDDRRLREIAQLQQKAAALEAEVTRRKDLEAKLRRRETERKRAHEDIQRLAAIVESSDDAIISKDLSGTIQSWNKGAERIFGYTADEIIGKSVMTLIPPDRLEEEAGILKRLRAGEPIDHYETLRRRKNGTLIDVSLTVSPIRDTDGKVVGASKVARDITDSVRAKEKLEEAVAERTASLREAMAQMEEFSYTVSHDLRAPLRGMQVYTDALLEDFAPVLPPEAARYLDRIAKNAARLDKMILNVLTFSRIARTELRLERVNMDRLVHQIVEHYPGLQAPGAEMQIKPLHEVIGHEPSLTQALSNLLNNAVKFVAPNVKPKVSVWSERQEDRVRICIADNGIGVDPKFHHRLFSMFERVHPASNYEGTGVGLAIVRKAVERMGGKVGIESDGVSGSRFWIELRAADAL